MSFDPEKVERWETWGNSLMQSSMGEESPEPKYVLASDYDQLLELYQQALSKIDDLELDIRSLHQ